MFCKVENSHHLPQSLFAGLLKEEAMRSKTSIVVVIISLFAFVGTLNAQWVPVHLPGYRKIVKFASSGMDIYAGASGGGLYRSTDGGSNWLRVTFGFAGDSVTALAAFGTNVFVDYNDNDPELTLSEGMWCSSDNGESWTASGLPPDLKVNAMLVSGTTLIAATSGGGINFSNDSGKTWTQANTGTSQIWVSALAASGEDLYAGGYGNTVYHSSDSGRNWTPKGTTTNRSITAIEAHNNNLLAATYSDALFRSSDSGATWIPTGPGLGDTVIRSLGHCGADFFAVTSYHGVYRSTDFGASWTHFNTDSTEPQVYSIASSNGYLFLGADFGIYRSSNLGVNWTQVSASFDNGQGFVTIGDELFAGNGPSGVFSSENDGGSWVRRNNGLTDMNVGALVRVGDHLLAQVDNGDIFLSSDRGANWSMADTNHPAFSIFKGASSGPYVIVVSPQGIFRSTDAGFTWKLVSDGLKDTSFYSVTVSGDYWFAGTRECGIYRSTDEGEHWAQVQSLPGNPFAIWSLAVSGSHLIAGSYCGIFCSSNNGKTWTHPVNTGLTDTVIKSLVAFHTDMFAATAYAGVFHSTDFGATWTELNSGLLTGYSSGWVPIMFASDTLLFAQTEIGLFKLPLSDIVTLVTPRAGEYPTKFSLDQNYPNPFNPSTTIRYSLPHRSHAFLTVFNTLGQKVAELVNGEMEAGYHDVTFNGKNLASGMYFYRLQSGDLVQTRKLLLLK